MSETASEGAARGTVRQVFLAFLVLGLTSFGGPVAHFGYFRTAFVERRKWLSEAAYAELVALCQFLPGPGSSQVGIAIGLMRAGYLGAFAAWTAFTLPSALLLILFAYGLDTSGLTTPGLITGFKLAALAVVAQAVLAMMPGLAPDRPRQLLAMGAAALLLVFPGALIQVGVILGSAAVGTLVLRVDPQRAAEPARVPTLPAALAFLGLFVVLLLALPVLAHTTGNDAIDLIDRFFRSGALVFGGGHVVLPLLSEAVVTPGLVSSGDFLAGYGAAQAVPGPLFSFAAYLGFVIDRPVGGWAGAALALGAVYLPSFLLVFGALPFWSRLSANRHARAALASANAGVLGILGAALYSPVFTSAVGAPLHLAIALAGFAGLTVLKLPPWLVVLFCALAGLML